MRNQQQLFVRIIEIASEIGGVHATEITAQSHLQGSLAIRDLRFEEFMHHLQTEFDLHALPHFDEETVTIGEVAQSIIAQKQFEGEEKIVAALAPMAAILAAVMLVVKLLSWLQSALQWSLS